MRRMAGPIVDVGKVENKNGLRDVTFIFFNPIRWGGRVTMLKHFLTGKRSLNTVTFEQLLF